MVKLFLSLSDKSPFITSVSLINKSPEEPKNETEPFTVIYPLIVILYPVILVWVIGHVGLQLAGVSQLPV